MSSFKRKIIKSTNPTSKQPVHINDRAVGAMDDYIEGNTQAIIKELIAETKKQIEEEKNRVLSSLQEERERAIQSGYDEGYRTGKEKILAEVREELEQEFQHVHERYQEAALHLQQIHEETVQKQAQWVAENQDALLSFLVTAAESILHTQIDRGEFDAATIVSEAMDAIRDESHKVWARVHPATYQLLKDKNVSERNVEWVADPSMGMADVEIETNTEYVDARLSRKIEALRTLIKGMMKHD